MEKTNTTNAYNCKSCGGTLVYKPGTDTLLCNYCGTTQSIDKEDFNIEELDFEDYLANIKKENLEKLETTKIITCSTCKAKSTFDENLKSMICPYCNSALVEADIHQERYIKPEYVAPFQISREQVNEILKKWANGLWFAPSNIQKAILSPIHLHGIYTPYWTYDANTRTSYTGERGDTYYVTVGNEKNRREERHIRWRFASGTISNFYDDILIPASRTMDLKLLSNIKRWNTKNIVKINNSYLAGFITEKYQIDLSEGFKYAQNIIEQNERQKVKSDIGGDKQRITTMDVKYANIKFKHILLPVYVSAFRYENKLYTFYINGFTGHITGKQPYSYLKIALAVLTALLIFAVFALLFIMFNS